MDRENEKIVQIPKEIALPHSLTEGLTFYHNYQILEEEDLPVPGSYSALVTTQDEVPTVLLVGDFNPYMEDLDYLNERELEERENEILELGASIRDLIEEGRVMYGEPLDDFDTFEGLSNLIGYDTEKEDFVIKDMGELPSDHFFEDERIPASSRGEFLEQNGIDEAVARILSN